MDYDDNDFQSKNLHIAGEGSNKYPPGLQPYALPKFDFDDSLNGHLRFDGLVETEVFLGIEGNEDNHWIEDFSRGNSSVVFRSSAAESCAVPRHDNVWSEATSSESVEMLLKSVGQDEVITGQSTVNNKSDDCDELGCIIKQMEPGVKHDDSSFSKIEAVALPPVPSEGTTGELTGLKEDLGFHQPLDTDASQTGGGDTSGDRDLGASVSGGNQNVILNLHDVSEDAKGKGNVNTSETIKTKSPGSQRTEESCAPGSGDHNMAFVQSTVTNSSVFNNKEACHIKNNVEDSLAGKSDGDNENCPALDDGLCKDDVMRKEDAESGDLQIDGNNDKKDLTISTGSAISGHSGEILHTESSECLQSEVQARDALGYSAFKLSETSPGDSTCRQSDSGEKNENLQSSCQDMKYDMTDLEASLSSLEDMKASECKDAGNVRSCEDGCVKTNEASSSSELIAEIHVTGASEGECVAFAVSGSESTRISSDRNDVLEEIPCPSAYSEQVTEGIEGNHADANAIRASACSKQGTEVTKDSCAEANVILEGSEKIAERENQEEIKKASEAEIATERNETPFQPLTLLIDKSCDDIAQNASTTPVIGNTGAEQITLPITSGNSSSVGNCTGSASLSEPLVESHVPKSREVPADSNEQSATHPVVHNSGVSQSKDGTEKVQELWGQPLPASMPMDTQLSKENETRGGNNNLTFKAPDIHEKQGEENSQLAAAQVANQSSIDIGPSSTTGLEKNEQKSVKDVSHEDLQVADKEITRSGLKGTPERKARRASKPSGKETSKKGNMAKETPLSAMLQSCNRTSKVLLGSAGLGLVARPVETHVETGSLKPFALFSSSVSSLPDLNSAGPNAIFQRPFTDLQQVQLRAQIFVYGSLIQGTAPDEAYMISAFGGHDGGRSMWENAWRDCIQRIHAQKLNLVNAETPLQSRSGARAPDQTTKSMILSKAASPAIGRASSKETLITPSGMLPLSSPLWGVPMPRDTLQSSGMPRGAAMDNQPILTSFHPHQTPPVKNMVGHSTSWLSPTPFAAPWVASPQANAYDANSRFSAFPVSETGQLQPVKELSMSHSLKHLLPGPVVNNGGSGSAITGSPLIDPKKATASPVQHSTDTKSRKRRKIPFSEERSQNLLHSQSQIEPLSAPVGASSLPTSVSAVTPAKAVIQSSQKIITSVSPSTLTHQHVNKEHEVKESSLLSEETHGNLKEARMHAEQAADLAAAAISRSQDIWKQMEKENDSGLEPDVEKKLASAAITIAAAAAVAKAAAAAANVASNAAFQAKMMADETLASSHGDEISASDFMRVKGKASPASIVSVDGKTAGPTSVLTAAREAARKRIEAAATATKQAENVDAILRAAELATEAVSQAGKIVAMSDPLPVAELLKGGPEGYWKAPIIPHKADRKSDYSSKEHGNIVGACPTSSGEHYKGASLGGKEEGSNLSMLPTSQGMVVELDPARPVIDVSVTGKKTKGRKSPKGSDSAKAVVTLLDSDMASTAQENAIKEGSHVEVFKEGDGFRAAWYPANVLSLKDGKAYVCYADLSWCPDAEKLKEWVAVEGEGGRPPIIRPARPITVMPFEGTRKRRREAIGDNTWVVGDRVDAWVQDSWWEGVITEKKPKDETTLTVHFTAQGETLTVKAWHLRPSLVWRNGKWIEFLASGGNKKSSQEGDTPHEKRQRLGSLGGGKGLDKNGKDAETMESVKPHQLGSLNLATDELAFNIGRSTKANTKPGSLKVPRSGLQKEGSRVIFGVPKPGKKRKFMEVSKHYVAEPSNKMSEPKDSVKFTKYLMPQTSGPRGWKNTSKAEPKEKRVAVPKSKVFKPGKTSSASDRTNPKENDVLKTGFAARDTGGARGRTTDDGKSVDHNGKTSSKHNSSESQCLPGAEGIVADSSSHVSSDAPENASILSTKGERASKGKLAPLGGLARIEETKHSNEISRKVASDIVEPRRSNRRIQPTSRLLEGLQSSMIISKIPSGSHERGHKSHNRTGSRGK